MLLLLVCVQLLPHLLELQRRFILFLEYLGIDLPLRMHLACLLGQHRHLLPQALVLILEDLLHALPVFLVLAAL
jgi:hypothetical protein